MMSETDIKIEMMDVCKKFWLLFFEEKIDMFSRGYEMKKAYSNYKNYYEEEVTMEFYNKTFGVRLGRVVNKMSTTKNKTRYRYYQMKDSVKTK
jgi:hypothetical protein